MSAAEPTDAELVALLLAEARSHRALDSVPPSDPPNEFWLRWFRDEDALNAAVQARLDAEAGR